MITKSVSGVIPAYCPSDGGKWAIYCEHIDDAGEIVGCGVVQDTNKRRLSGWVHHTIDWCCYCQEERDAARDEVLLAADALARAALGSDWTLEAHVVLKRALLGIVDGVKR